jgi:putative Mg2+ transporter-C (MgtC) family protein
MLDWSEILLRLGIAALAGGALGLNRDLHGKPVGVRTLSLVSIAAAMVMVLADPLRDGGFSDAGSRVIQGILTGIGFLGAGVIFHAEKHFRIRGLTSAACTWLTACVGIVCGVGEWRIVTVALAITFVVLLIGGPVERRLHRLLGGQPDHDLPADEPQSSASGPHQPGK